MKLVGNVAMQCKCKEKQLLCYLAKSVSLMSDKCRAIHTQFFLFYLYIRYIYFILNVVLIGSMKSLMGSK